MYLLDNSHLQGLQVPKERETVEKALAQGLAFLESLQGPVHPWQVESALDCVQHLQCAGLCRGKQRAVEGAGLPAPGDSNLRIPSLLHLARPQFQIWLCSGHGGPTPPHLATYVPACPSGDMAGRLLASYGLPLETRLTLPVSKS